MDKNKLNLIKFKISCKKRPGMSKLGTSAYFVVKEKSGIKTKK